VPTLGLPSFIRGTSWLGDRKLQCSSELSIISRKVGNANHIVYELSLLFTQLIPRAPQIARGLGRVTSSSTVVSGKGLRTGETTPSCRWTVSESPSLAPSYIQGGLSTHADLVGCCFLDPGASGYRDTAQCLGEPLLSGESGTWPVICCFNGTQHEAERVSFLHLKPLGHL